MPDTLGHLLHVSATLIELRTFILNHFPQGRLQVIRVCRLVCDLALLHMLGNHHAEAKSSSDDQPVMVEHLLLGLLQGVPVENHTGLHLGIPTDLIALLIQHGNMNLRVVHIRNTAHEGLNPESLHLHLALFVGPKGDVLPLRQKIQQTPVQGRILAEVHEMRGILLDTVGLLDFGKGQTHVVEGVLAQVLHGLGFHDGLFVGLLQLSGEGLALL
mmetsp:Transcript_7676/g.16379  ORF Transcript_7676/g.16379 Transcript_7676/m.16379 type:complete len:215 (-) Transcript_7676:126-770(-)